MATAVVPRVHSLLRAIPSCFDYAFARMYSGRTNRCLAKVFHQRRWEDTMSKTAAGSAAARYAARVDAVLAQRTRLRGPQPPGDLFAGLPAANPLLTSDPRRALDPG